MIDIQSKIHTITFDNGLEFAHHEVIAKGLGADVYFAHPYCSWEHGINENTNGLIRQYFPKGTDFNQVTDKQVQWVMKRLNNRQGKRGAANPRMNYLQGRRWIYWLHNLIALVTRKRATLLIASAILFLHV